MRTPFTSNTNRRSTMTTLIILEEDAIIMDQSPVFAARGGHREGAGSKQATLNAKRSV